MIETLRSKRARRVAEHILKYGHITTDDIRGYLGYKDPYRPTMDLRDEGIPLEDYKIKTEDGRTISAYKFGDVRNIRLDRIGGRKAFSKKFKDKVIEAHGTHCSICLDKLQGRYLQIDHRIPYQISGEGPFEERQVENYMLLCRSCNRAKSWSCETCPNFIDIRDSKICETCYWAMPDSYKHVATRNTRRLDLVWPENEVPVYDFVHALAERNDKTVAEFIKNILRKLAEGQP